MLRERQSSKIVVTWWQNGGRTSRVSHFTLGQGLVGSFALPFFYFFHFFKCLWLNSASLLQFSTPDHRALWL